MGQWVIDDDAGIRTHPYSTSASTNPLRYSSIRTLNEVHNIGEIWANLLHNVYAALVKAHGYSSSARTDPSSAAGNSVFMHLFLDALALQVPLVAPQGAIAPIKAIEIGELGLAFSVGAPWAPVARSRAVTAALELPFGFGLAVGVGLEKGEGKERVKTYR